MPYIKQENRVKFDEILKNIPPFANKGELEYCIYSLMCHYMLNRDFCYTELHNATYAAIHCGDEFRRQHLDAREDDAIMTNGAIELPFENEDNEK